MNTNNFVYSLFIALLASVANGKAPTECVDILDTSLVTTLRAKYPKMHIPKISELGESDVEHDIQDSGNGCYVAMAGDFSGKGQKDYAIAMTTSIHSKVRIIVAMKQSSKWVLFNLPSFCDDISSCFVRRQSPGEFRRSLALDNPLEGKLERQYISSKFECIRTGTLESTEVVYVFSDGHWHYVITSD